MKPFGISVVISVGLASTTAVAAPELARRANDFVDSVCVATHWSYPDTPYGARFDEVKTLLVDSHIRHCRDGLHPHLHDLAQAGVTCTVVTNTDSPSPDPSKPAASTDEIRNAIKAFNAVSPPAIDSIEGPNEPDLFWFTTVNGQKTPNRTYGGQPFPAGAVAFLRDLRTSLRADPATAALPFIGIALGSTLAPNDPNPLGNSGELSGVVDWGNFHPYCGGNPFSPDYFFDYDSITHYYMNTNYPSDNLDWVTPVAEKPYGALPMAATETGYSTNTGSISLALHGKYMPRLFLEYFRRGIKRACSYELVDEHDNPADRESNFGLLKYDLTPKPAYVGVKNLLALLEDRDATFAPGALEYTMTMTPVTATVRGQMVTYDHLDFVHHVLLQKGDGRFELVLWHEIGDADTSTTPMVELSPPPIPVTITTPQSFASATLYRFDEDNALHASSTTPGAISTEVTDRPLVIEWVPAPAAASDAGAGIDAASTDGAPPIADDASLLSDAAPTNADAPASSDSGCGCRAATADGEALWACGIAALAAISLARRRRP